MLHCLVMAFQGVGQVYAGGVDGNVHVMLVLSLNVRVLPVILEHSVRKASADECTLLLEVNFD